MRCLQLYMPVLPDVFFFFLFFHCDNYKRHSHKHGTNHHSPLIYCCHAQIACDSADGEHCVYAEKKQAFSQIVPVFMSDIFAYGRSRCSHIAYTHCGGTGVALRICASYAYFSECLYLCAAGKRNDTVAKDIKLIRYKCRRKECHRLEQNNYLPSVECSALEDMMHRLCKHNTCYKSHYRSKISEGDNKIAFCQIYRHKKNISRLGVGEYLSSAHIGVCVHKSSGHCKNVYKHHRIFADADFLFHNITDSNCSTSPHIFLLLKATKIIIGIKGEM